MLKIRHKRQAAKTLAVILKAKFKHIKHLFENIPEKGFFILNEFKSESVNTPLVNILDSDLLDEDYFSTEKQKKELQKQIDQMTSYAKMMGAYNENEQIELYGPILKDK